jgi:hypothetical protein
MVINWLVQFVFYVVMTRLVYGTSKVGSTYKQTASKLGTSNKSYHYELSRELTPLISTKIHYIKNYLELFSSATIQIFRQ